MARKKTYGKTASGKPITDALIDKLAEKAEAGYDVDELASLLRALGLRPEVDQSGETVGKKVRAAQLAKAPYVLVIGDKEIESGELTVRDREGVETKGVPFDDFAAALVDEAASKRLTQSRFGG